MDIKKVYTGLTQINFIFKTFNYRPTIITKEKAINLQVGDYIYQHFKLTSSVTNGITEIFPPNRWKVNGKVQTWKQDQKHSKFQLNMDFTNFHI